MTYSSFAEYIPSQNYGDRLGCKIDRITVHHMACNGSLLACRNSWVGKIASANYGVDSNGNIACFVPEEYRSYASSNGENDRHAITIEVANDKPSNAEGWHVSDQAISRLIKLLIDVCQRNNIQQLKWKNDSSLKFDVEQQNMTVHNWFAATQCPGPYLMEKMGYIAEQVNNGLNDSFNPTEEEFVEMFNDFRANLQEQEGSNWSAEARDWAIHSGKIFNGDGQGNYMWKDFVSREQLAQVLKSFYNKMV